MSKRKDLANMGSVQAVRWQDDACLLLDQRRLPQQETYLRLEDSASVARAISDMVVRGAPAIGIAAAYGVALAVRETESGDRAGLQVRLDFLAAARPTASNLVWAIRRVSAATDPGERHRFDTALAEARAIHAEDIAMNLTMGELGAGLIDGPCSVVTHCNAGALATGGFGTALGVVRCAWASGRIQGVFAGETRPWQQGSRLTCWELARDEIPVTLLVDSAMAQMFRQQHPPWLIVGADRVTANGDVANKIGTYSLAVLARQHGGRVMVVAPTSTLDLSTPDGDSVPIEHRSGDEIWTISGQPSGINGVAVDNPVFDITPASCVDALVTEKGIVQAPDSKKIFALLSGGR